MKVEYQVVTMDGATILDSAEAVAALYPAEDRKGGDWLRVELRGKQCFKGLCGPMWGGWVDADGEACFPVDDNQPEGQRRPYGSQAPITGHRVRYETWEANELYSR